MQSVLDDRAGRALLSYVEAAGPVQEMLRQVLTQVAGCSLMIMTRSGPAARPEGAMQLARVAAGRAHEELRGLEVPAEAGHHFHHLSKVSEAIRGAFRALEACSAPGACDADRDELTRALNEAAGHLRLTARLLPGFETVDLGQACCAVHAGAGLAARAG